MNINWLESEFWDQVTATQMVVNLERFLTSANPVPAAFNAQWAGYAASAGGVSDVSGKWTVPTVECSEVAAASAVGTWVGIDGFGNNNLVKAGAGVTCSSPNARPCYYLFTKVLPGAESPITGCSGVAPAMISPSTWPTLRTVRRLSSLRSWTTATPSGNPLS